ncbi:MAG: ImmA/IrrE family metallo-endopeptidase [Alphaproteobacteria bacterium]
MNFAPNWASPLHDTVARILASSELTIDELAVRLECSEDLLIDILEGREALGSKLAHSFSKELGSTPQFWQTRSRQFFEDSDRLQTERTQGELAQWGAQFPVQAMRKLGWLPKRHRGTKLSEDILEFFGCATVPEWRHRYSTGIGEVAFRTSFAFETNELATLAWLRTGEKLANQLPASDFSIAQFSEMAPSLKKYCVYKHPSTFFGKLQKACADYGVKLVSSRAPAGCRASGASWISEDGNPVVLVSFRHLSEDHFWFTFFHEVGHVVLHDPAHIEIDGTDPSPLANSEHEEQADTFAQDTLVQPNLREELVSSVPTKTFVRSIARRANVTPGIVVGQLQKAGCLQPSQLNFLKRRYRWGSSTHLPELV